MPRKKQTDKTQLKELAISDAADISELQSTKRISREEGEDIPFAEIIPEMDSSDEKAGVPHFVEADVAPVSTPALDSEALDTAIQEARAHKQPVQTEPFDNSTVYRQEPASGTIREEAVFPVDIAPPPPVVLAAAGILLIFLFAFK